MHKLCHQISGPGSRPDPQSPFPLFFPHPNSHTHYLQTQPARLGKPRDAAPAALSSAVSAARAKGNSEMSHGLPGPGHSPRESLALSLLGAAPTQTPVSSPSSQTSKSPVGRAGTYHWLLDLVIPCQPLQKGPPYSASPRATEGGLPNRPRRADASIPSSLPPPPGPDRRVPRGQEGKECVFPRLGSSSHTLLPLGPLADAPLPIHRQQANPPCLSGCTHGACALLTPTAPSSGATPTGA